MPILGSQGSGTKGPSTAPTIGTATAGNGNASVTFSAPSFSKLPITSYTVTSSSGASNTGASSPIVVTETVAGTRTYTVTATSAAGVSPASSASNSLVFSAPAAPTIGTATLAGGQSYTGSASISVPFTANATGNAAITSYAVTSSSTATNSGSASPISVSETVGNPTSTARTYTVTATNKFGTSSASSASNSIAAVSVPQAPTIGAATAGNASATVAYTANATGGAAVSTFTATSSPGGFTGTGASPITVSGLSNGTAYTFTVTATNSAGTSAASSASSSVTPSSPAFVNLTASNGGAYAVAGEIDSSGNIYSFDGRGSHGTIFKYNSTGALQSQRQLIEQNTFALNRGVVYDGTIDSSGNVYVCGSAVNGNTTSPFAAKYDSSFNLLWARRSDNTSYAGNQWQKIHVDSAGNVICGGNQFNYSSSSGNFVKFNSSGTLQWAQNNAGNDGNFQSGITNGVVTDSSNNIYFLGSHFTAGSALLYKYAAAGGSITAQRELYTSNTNYKTAACDLVIDSSGNLYALTLGNSQDSYISKFDSSLNLVWQVATTSNPSLEFVSHKMHVDSSGSVYMIGHRSSVQSHILKWNSSGTFQWQRQINDMYVADIKSVGNDIVFFGRLLNNNSIFMLRVPNDGSKTGTYTFGGVTRTYQASSLTIGANIPLLVRTSTYNVLATTGQISITNITPVQSTPTFTSSTVAI
jgi:hypothetical protein